MARMLRTITLLLLLPLALGAAAQEVSILAQVDKRSVAAGDHIVLTVTLNNAQQRFTSPDLGGLVILRGPSEGSRVTTINGRTSISVTRTWVLTATQPGRYTIGPAKVQIGNSVLQSDPITIEVGKAAAVPSDPYATQGQGRDANLFVTTTLSRNRGFVGEQLVITYTLYSRYLNLEAAGAEWPKLDGFWTEEVDVGTPRFEDQPRTVNGVQYRVAVLRRQVLFPQRPGKLRIEPLKVSYVVDRTFFNRGRRIDLTSNALDFIAEALPAGAPASFNGMVGDLRMTVTADRTKVHANEAIEISMKFSGTGQLKLLDPPRLSMPSDLETYDPKVVDRITVNAGGMSGSREFQFLVIPRYEGIYELDDISFSYFDPKARSYKTLRADALTLEVLPGRDGTASTAPRHRKTDVQVLDSDIRYIRTGDLALRPKGEQLFGSVPYVVGLTTPALAFLLFLVWRQRRAKMLADGGGMRRRAADRVARKRLEQAAEALRENAPGPFHDALSKALRGYLADKLGLGVAELSAARVKEHLRNEAGGAELAERYERLLGICDMARFAPLEERPRQDLYDEAAKLIGELERTLRT
jgi:hypothetical protein